MATTKREVYDFNSDHMVKKVNTNTCIILAQCLYLGHSIEWANDVNEISEALDNNLTLSDLNKIINVEEGSNYLGFEREDGDLHYAGFKKGKMGAYTSHKLRLEIEREDIFRDTCRKNDYTINEYAHTPFILSMAIFLGKSIEWAIAINETLEIVRESEFTNIDLVNSINNAINDESRIILNTCKYLIEDDAWVEISTSIETLLIRIDGRDLLNGFEVNKTYEFQL